VLIFLQLFPNIIIIINIIIKYCSGENLYYFFDLSIEAVLSVDGKNPHGVFVSVNTLFTSRFFTALLFI